MMNWVKLELGLRSVQQVVELDSKKGWVSRSGRGWEWVRRLWWQDLGRGRDLALMLFELEWVFRIVADS